MDQVTHEELEMKRVNIRVTKQVDDWFTARSKMTGLSKSALMYLALESHIQNAAALNFMSVLPDVMERLDDLEQRKASVSGS